MSRRMFAAIGTGACLTAALLSAIAAGFRAIDRELSDFHTDTTFVPVEWADAFFEENQ